MNTTAANKNPFDQPFRLHGFPKDAAAAFVQSLPVQLFWPPAPPRLRLRAIVVTIINPKTPE